MSVCKCIEENSPVEPCNDDCWHFGNNKSVCINCNNTGYQINEEVILELKMSDRFIVSNFVFSCMKKRGGLQIIIDNMIKLYSGLKSAEEQTNFCFVCGNHPDRHSNDCPMNQQKEIRLNHADRHA